MAGEALQFHIAGMIEDGDDIPSPSSLDHIITGLADRNAVAALIDVEPPSKAVRINFDPRGIACSRRSAGRAARHNAIRNDRGRLETNASAECSGKHGRSDRIRTCDPQTPSLMRYQAALRSDGP